MSDIKVYDSQGEEMYPNDTGVDTKMASYFDSHILSIGKSDKTYILEAYLNVDTGTRKEQVAVRYSSDNTNSTLSDCRQRIQQVLVDKLGWEIRKPFGNKPGRVSWGVICDDEIRTSEQYSAYDLYTDSEFGLGLTNNEADLLVEQGDTTVRINASGYEEIAKIVPAFADDDKIIVTSREKHAPPDYADIHFSVSDQQWDTFELHPATRKALDQKKTQVRFNQRTETLQNLSQNLKMLDELDTAEDTVTQQLNSAMSNTQFSLRVVDKSTARQTNNDVVVSSPSTSSRTVSVSSNLRSKKKLVFIFLLSFFIVVGLILGAAIMLDQQLLDFLPG